MSIRLLIIEDDGEIATLLTRYLSRHGFLVTHVKDGEAGVRAFKAHPFDVVLVDGVLPRKNGVEVCREIRATEAGARVGLVMMSAGYRGDEVHRLGAGVDAFFGKPFVVTELKEKLEELSQRGQAAPEPPLELGGILGGGEVRDGFTVARALLGLARGRATGVLVLSDAGSSMRLALQRGVVVGAWDNLRENLLGERLWRRGLLTAEEMRQVNARMAAHQERVAEALVSLGLCDAATALAHLDEQARDRLRRAARWAAGRLAFVEDAPAVARMATTALDLVEELLWAGLSREREAEARDFAAERGGSRLSRTADFDEGVAAFARLRPASPLPRALAAGPLQVTDAAAHEGGALEVLALRLAGLAAAEGDPPLPARATPRPLGRGGRGQGIIDAERAAQVSQAVLRVRGRTLYEGLQVSPAAPRAEIEGALARLRAELGPDALQGTRLGPARGAARELWAFLEEAALVLGDDARRAAYDRDLPRTGAAPPAAFEPEHDFLDGQISFALGDQAAARAAFERAAAARPGDPEYVSYAAWLRLLEGAEAEVTSLHTLEDAARAHPQAMRPLFFLGLAHARRGDRAQARRFLQEAARRAPADVEVQGALSALEE